MPIRQRAYLMTWGFLAVLALPCSAQMGTGEAANVLKAMPPDLFTKVQALAQQLQQGIKAGKLTETDVQQGLFSGQLTEKLKDLNPQARQILEEISEAMKTGQGPGEARGGARGVAGHADGCRLP